LFRQFFGENILKIITSVPGLPDRQRGGQNFGGGVAADVVVAADVGVQEHHAAAAGVDCIDLF
jgi:hypothetical protein